jgi:predicted 2-oxoglutarate/Fe(II)-dependent dioxygenase YbiX
MNTTPADPENITIIKNFIKDEHLKTIMNSLLSIKNWNNLSGEILPYREICKTNPEICQIMSDYIDEIQKMLEFKFATKLNKAQVGIYRMLPGELLPPHSDIETLDGLPKNNYSIDYSTLVHLNDDYSGGELYFPEYDISFKPEAGNLVIFPSNRYFLHGVTKIESKPRFTSGHFWGSTKNTILVETARNKAANQHVFEKFHGYEEL